MATENAIEREKTSNEEEAAVAINWQSGDSDNSGSYENPEDELGYLLHKRRGLKRFR
jgi:hypothetical protein